MRQWKNPRDNEYDKEKMNCSFHIQVKWSDKFLWVNYACPPNPLENSGCFGKIEIWKRKQFFDFTFPWVSDLENHSSCPEWVWQMTCFLYTVKPANVVTSIKHVPFSCPVIKNFIWIGPLLRGHLSYKATVSWSQGWPLNTGLTTLFQLSLVDILLSYHTLFALLYMLMYQSF